MQNGIPDINRHGQTAQPEPVEIKPSDSTVKQVDVDSDLLSAGVGVASPKIERTISVRYSLDIDVPESMVNSADKLGSIEEILFDCIQNRATSSLLKEQSHILTNKNLTPEMRGALLANSEARLSMVESATPDVEINGTEVVGWKDFYGWGACNFSEIQIAKCVHFHNLLVAEHDIDNTEDVINSAHTLINKKIPESDWTINDFLPTSPDGATGLGLDTNKITQTVYKECETRFDMTGRSLGRDLIHADDYEISPELVNSLVDHAKSRMEEGGFTVTDNIEVYSIVDEGESVHYGVEFVNKMGGKIKVEGILIDSAGGFIDHGFSIEA